MKALWIAAVLSVATSPGAAVGESGEAPVLAAGSAAVVRLGAVTLNKAERMVTFPAAVNMTNGLLEYAIVHQDGKVHESVLKTEIKPYQLHAAMLLLGVTATNAVGSEAASGQIETPARIEPKGDPIEIHVAWTGPQPVQKPLSSLIFNKATGQALQDHSWVYNGSRVSQGKFLAELSGSLVSLITDLDALMNSTSKGHDDDTIWQVNTNAAPPTGTAVQVTIKLLPPRDGGKPEGD